MKFKIALCFFVLAISTVCCQYNWTPGEIVLKNGDVLQGQVKLPMVTRNMSAFSGRERVRFRQDRKAKTVNYDEGQVGQIIFRRSDGEGAFYEYVRVSDNKTGLFLVVTSGEVTLYARRVNIATTSPAYRSDPDDGPYYNYNYSESDEFFVKRADESIATPLIVSGVLDSFRKRAMDYFSDCLTLVAKIDDSVYKKGDVVAVVEAYNACR